MHNEAFWSAVQRFVSECICECVCLPSAASSWECCCRWGLLTELELSFHTGGNFFFLHLLVCVCLSLPPPPPAATPQTASSHLPPPSELTFFIPLLLYSCCDVGQGWGWEQLKIRQDRTVSMYVCGCTSSSICVYLCVWERLCVCWVFGSCEAEREKTSILLCGCGWVCLCVWICACGSECGYVHTICTVQRLM